MEAPLSKAAPEHPFPYTFEEGLDLLSYVESHAEDLGGSKDNLVLMGQSAGANLITGMTLTFLEEGRKLPTGLICCYLPSFCIKRPAQRLSSCAYHYGRT